MARGPRAFGVTCRRAGSSGSVASGSRYPRGMGNPSRRSTWRPQSRVLSAVELSCVAWLAACGQEDSTDLSAAGAGPGGEGGRGIEVLYEGEDGPHALALDE